MSALKFSLRGDGLPKGLSEPDHSTSPGDAVLDLRDPVDEVLDLRDEVAFLRCEIGVRGALV